MKVLTGKKDKRALECFECQAKVNMAIYLAEDFCDTGGATLCKPCIEKALKIMDQQNEETPIC